FYQNLIAGFGFLNNVDSRFKCAQRGWSEVASLPTWFQYCPKNSMNRATKVAFILGRFPLYHHMKFAFLVWLQLPTTNGAKLIYMNHLRPFLLKHQANLDQIVALLYSETNKFVSAHQGEFVFVKAIVMKILISAKHLVNDSSQPNPPVPPPAGRAITGLNESGDINPWLAAHGSEYAVESTHM
ncbi:hypothetical protein M8C21_020592, partial [Ambrosia artemisiifolia]